MPDNNDKFFDWLSRTYGEEYAKKWRSSYVRITHRLPPELNELYSYWQNNVQPIEVVSDEKAEDSYLLGVSDWAETLHSSGEISYTQMVEMVADAERRLEAEGLQPGLPLFEESQIPLESMKSEVKYRAALVKEQASQAKEAIKQYEKGLEQKREAGAEIMEEKAAQKEEELRAGNIAEEQERRRREYLFGKGVSPEETPELSLSTEQMEAQAEEGRIQGTVRGSSEIPISAERLRAKALEEEGVRAALSEAAKWGVDVSQRLPTGAGVISGIEPGNIILGAKAAMKGPKQRQSLKSNYVGWLTKTFPGQNINLATRQWDNLQRKYGTAVPYETLGAKYFASFVRNYPLSGGEARSPRKVKGQLKIT